MVDENSEEVESPSGNSDEHLPSAYSMLISLMTPETKIQKLRQRALLWKQRYMVLRQQMSPSIGVSVGVIVRLVKEIAISL